MTDMRILLLATALLSPCGFAQGPGHSPPLESKTAPAAVEQWIRQLGSDKYRERLDAENKLREQGKAAQKALEAAAADESDHEMQWRAKRLLRQLQDPKKAKDQGKSRLEERRPMAGGRAQGQGPGGSGRGTDGSVDEVIAELDQLLLELGKERGVDLEGAFRPLLDSLRDSQKRMRAQIGMKTSPFSVDDDRDFMDRIGGLTLPLVEMDGSSVQITPDGVRVEVRETNEDGESKTKVYEAPDMETFKQKYPDVLKKTGAGALEFKGLGLQGLLPQWGSGHIELDKLMQGFDKDLLKRRVVPFDQGFVPPVAGQPSASGVADRLPAKGRRLGVAIQDIPLVLRDYLELPAGVGLMVESVQPGTLAESLRLKASDIVVSINEHKVGSPSDVRDALTPIKKGEDVKVAFLRRGERREATTKKVETAAPAREPLEPKKKRSRTSIR